MDIQQISDADRDILRLDNQLCFALYAASRAVSKSYRAGLTDLGLTYPQYLVLITLWHEDGLTISEIGEQLMLDSGTLTPLVTRLEAAGTVRRERSRDDRREVQVFLTEQGQSLMGHAAGVRRDVGCALGMTPEELLVLRSDLMQLIARLESHEGADATQPEPAPA